jgi:GDP-L-fucose synthase
MLRHINVGCGQDIAIREFAETIGNVIGDMREISLDPGKPDGAA